MRIAISCILVLLLTGCGAPGTSDTNETSNPAPPAEELNYEGGSGIRLFFDADIEEIDRVGSWYENHYLDVAQCMGKNPTPGPVVRVIKRLPGQNDGGRTAWSDGQVSVWGYACVRHEFVHYLLWRDQYPNDLNTAHDHPAFSACGLMAPIACRPTTIPD